MRQMKAGECGGGRSIRDAEDRGHADASAYLRLTGLSQLVLVVVSPR